MKDVSVNRKGSSLRDGHGVDKRDSAEESRILWRGKEEEEERESSRDSANSSTNGSEKEACARTETAVGVVLLFENDFGIEDRFGISDKRLRTVAVAISSSLFLQRSNHFFFTNGFSLFVSCLFFQSLFNLGLFYRPV